MSAQDEIFMNRALSLAKKGIKRVAPNPMVGAVIVHDGKIIGEGYHQAFGEPHAEVNAINSVQDQTAFPFSTIYVTLEPCAHFGKTPPCADLIIKKGFKKVVIATIDPSEKVGGKGIERIQEAGIEVEVGILKDEAAKLNKRFFSLHAKKRPYITLKWAETKDGFIGRDKNDSNQADNWITNMLSKQLVHQWRAEEMGILVGKTTAMIDNPALTCREVEGINPHRFLIDPSLSVPKEYALFNQDAPTTIFNLEKSFTKDNLEFVKVSNPSEIVSELFNYCLKHSIHSLLIEGGANTLQRFIDANLWDEARVFEGNKTFKAGVKGPTLNIEAYKTETLRDDVIRYYKNSIV